MRVYRQPTLKSGHSGCTKGDGQKNEAIGGREPWKTCDVRLVPAVGET